MSTTLNNEFEIREMYEHNLEYSKMSTLFILQKDYQHAACIDGIILI